MANPNYSDDASSGQMMVIESVCRAQPQHVVTICCAKLFWHNAWSFTWTRFEKQKTIIHWIIVMYLSSHVIVSHILHHNSVLLSFLYKRRRCMLKYSIHEYCKVTGCIKVWKVARSQIHNDTASKQRNRECFQNWLHQQQHKVCMFFTKVSEITCHSAPVSSSKVYCWWH